MSERKVLNKYYPPDFDPSKIPRLRLAKTRQYTVRLMAPCNMRCDTCHDYIAKGKKFNARKETVDDHSYLGLKVFRFYFKCPRCMAEITFKTDPKNMDYEVEHGATPCFKALKLAQQQAVQEQADQDEDERLNPMKLLENRTKQSRRELEELEALEDLKEINQRNRHLLSAADQALANANSAGLAVTTATADDGQLPKVVFEPYDVMERRLDTEMEAEERELLAKLNGKDKSDSESSDDEVLPKFGLTFDTIDKEFTKNSSNSNNDNTNGLNSNGLPKDLSSMSESSSKDSLKRKIGKLVTIKTKKTKCDDSLVVKKLVETKPIVKNNNNNNNVNNLLNLCAYSSSDSD